MDTQSLETLSEQVLTKLAEAPQGVQRLFHGRGRCFPGLEQITVDWLDGQILISLFKEPSAEALDKLNNEIIKWTIQTEWHAAKAKSLLLQHRSREQSPTECLWGDFKEQQVVNEDGLFFQLDLGKNQNSGL
ncbi:MAG: class I SAM-dependent methyltransferase, partial [Oceanospirillaceae bacterium]|nr:class I SAM-dependent methyltransferase [Oceanospirillaceae bacterium]